MKVSKIALIILLLSSLSVLSLSCAAKSDSAVSENQIVTVPRGNLTVDITAAGNLAFSHTEELAFDLFYPAGARATVWTVEEVLVEEGDPVEEGQVLARVDTSEWAEQLNTLEDRVTTAERQLTAKKRALLQGELNLIDAENALKDAEAQYVWPVEIFAAREAVQKAESDVEEAQAILRGDQLIYDRTTGRYIYYDELLAVWDRKVWNDKLTTAEATLGTARLKLDKLLAQSDANEKVKNAEARLSTAQAKLDNSLAEYTSKTLAESTSDSDKIEMQKKIEIQRAEVEFAKAQLTDAQNALEGVAKKRLQLELAEGNVKDAQLAIDDAEKALEDAQEDLDEARSKSPLITATFDGFVTNVNIEGGDEIKTGTVGVVIADPNKFEADILVNEMDILQIKLGGEAWVQVDAMPEISLSANVTHISPKATIQQGVVNYKVKVEIQSPESVMQERSEARQQATPEISPGELPERLRQAIEEGRITQEQAEERVKQRQQGEGKQAEERIKQRQQGEGKQAEERMRQRQQGEGKQAEERIKQRQQGEGKQAEERIKQRQQGQEGLTGREPGAQQEQFPRMAPEDFQLREGLTVTVRIIVDERNNVLLVPNKAITRQGQETYVQVLKDGVMEERAITTGISDWQFTEVSEGLVEGEQIIVPQGTATTSTTQQRQPQGRIVPGMGKMLR